RLSSRIHQTRTTFPTLIAVITTTPSSPIAQIPHPQCRWPSLSTTPSSSVTRFTSAPSSLAPSPSVSPTTLLPQHGGTRTTRASSGRISEESTSRTRSKLLFINPQMILTMST
ncbi:hypothetical protein PHBOTO_005897, partial [Pseudozyma hubeiensis]